MRYSVGEGKPFQEGIVLYSMQERTYTQLTDSGLFPTWLPDGHTILYAEDNHLIAIDVETHETRPIEGTSWDPDEGFYQYVSGFFYQVRQERRGDIWLLSER